MLGDDISGVDSVPTIESTNRAIVSSPTPFKAAQIHSLENLQ